MQGAGKPSPSSSLAEVVCQWQPTKLHELAKSYSDSCSPSQVTFSSYDKYKAYFEPLLLAEVAADLLSTSEKFQRSQPARQPKLRARREEPGANAALVVVSKVSRQHSWGFGWVADLDSHDRKGPVGCIDNDVVVLWSSSSSQTRHHHNHSRSHSYAMSRVIPNSAVLGVVVRVLTRTGSRVVLSKFPDGNEHGVRTDLEDGEENEDTPPKSRVWNLVRLGSLTTMKREFNALQTIKTSILLPVLLRPAQQGSGTVQEWDDSRAPVSSSITEKQSNQKTDSPQHRNEEHFTKIIASKTGLNTSQSRAILHASTCRNGFSVIQGPPGTGKTRTLISLLNVIHMTQYQEYYEGLLASFASMHGTRAQPSTDFKDDSSAAEARNIVSDKGTETDLLSSMLLAMSKTFSMASESKLVPISKRARRPRLLICAPSNSAVDEILTRLTTNKFIDGQGREYCPELARIGAGGRVSEAAKSFTAEGQAEAFLDRMCAEDMNAEAQKSAQTAFLTTWQNRCNSLLVQLARTPKRQASSHPTIIDLHEKLERMDRDLRRLSIAASDGAKALTREEKLRQIARTYVEDAQLVFSTLSGAASSILTKRAANDITSAEGALFDTVVIDEGAQATEPSCLIPMALGASRCLLVGDPQQLPATVLSSGAAGLAYGQSLLERVCKGGQNAQLLDTQYRMHPAISSFPRRYFYHGRLVDDESVQGENRARPYHRDAIRPKLGPYVFLDIADGEEMRSKDDRSIFNRSEAELASSIYTKLKREYPKESLFSASAKAQGSVTGFGVVTPYKRQMQELRQSFDRAGVPTGDVEIDTVDSFQGREKDVILFSCVRTASAHRGIGFVRDVRRMNVGLTRAKSSLIILGSAHALAEGSTDWAELVEDANSRGCLISVTNVARCLIPPMLNRKELSKSDPEFSKNIGNGNPLKQSRPRVTDNGMSEERNTSSKGLLDPRRRAARKLLIDVDNRKDDKNISHTSGSTGELHSDSDPSVVKQEQLTILKSDVEQKNSKQAEVNALRDKNLELQSTLKQLSRVLADGGVQNLSGIEKTLRDHISNGGALELEAIVAATVTNANSNAKDPPGPTSAISREWQQTPSSNAARITANRVPFATAISSDTTEKPPQTTSQSAVRTEDPKTDPILSNEDEALKVGVSNERKHVSERSNKTKKNSTKGRLATPNGHDRGADKKRDLGQGSAPSGWDMLFSAKGLPSEENKNIPAESKASFQPCVQGKVLSETEQEINVKNEEISKVAGSVPPNRTPRETNLTQFSEKTQPRRRNSPGENRQRKVWAENLRDADRKRQRSHEANFANVGRSNYRSGRGRGLRPKRSRGRGNFAYEQRTRENYTANEAWPTGQFAANVAPQHMANSIIEPNMGMPHAVDAMQVMQIMQQNPHMMQPAVQTQHVLQQQAIQQQAYQQHALHQQQFHHQAIPQDGLLPQATLMHMPGGMPLAAHTLENYQPSFAADANGGVHLGQESLESHEGRAHSGWSYRGGGRGRARVKHSGRNRRG